MENIKILFVCYAGMLRSATAMHLFARKEGFNVRCAGTEDYAVQQVQYNTVCWADVIVFMHPTVYDNFMERWDLSSLSIQPKIVILNIPDRYGFMEPELVSLIEKETKDYF